MESNKLNLEFVPWEFLESVKKVTRETDNPQVEWYASLLIETAERLNIAIGTLRAIQFQLDNPWEDNI